MFLTKFPKYLYISALCFLLILFVISLSIGGITWDECMALKQWGLHMQILHQQAVLSQIQGDDIYYGIVNILPQIKLYRWFHHASFGLSPDALPYFYSHISIFIMEVSTSYLVIKILQLLDIDTRLLIAWGRF
ncbi:MAG: hypothetical protein K0S08_257 [Gammaproteobacteria bacterium]|jgi:hypothetical protein|nr:hypothetical protein [Gammaproteobacteria bacterium]